MHFFTLSVQNIYTTTCAYSIYTYTTPSIKYSQTDFDFNLKLFLATIYT